MGDTVEFDGKQIRLMKIPKDTLLFRAVQHSESDFIGADVAPGKLCIPVNYNVFFYTSPFVVDGVHWFDKDFPNVDVYRTPHELTIVSMIKPSSLTRSSRKEKGQIIEACSEQKACLKGREYDPCFKPEFLKENPNVHGWIALTAADSREVLNAIKQGKLDAKDIPMVEDSRGVRGPPEIALYPLKTRSLKDIFIDHPAQWKSSKQGEYNYEHVVTLKRYCADRTEFMAKHAVYNPSTKLYTLKDASVRFAKDVVTDVASMLQRIATCMKAKEVSMPDIGNGLSILPLETYEGPWSESSESAKRTIEYIIDKLHHACYVLCVGDGKGQLFKIENRTTAPGFKESLFHPRNKTLRDAPDPSKQWRVIQCLVREYKDEESFTSEYAQFIQELKYPLPNGAYILNLTDAMLLRKDATEPWPFVTGSAPLESKYKDSYLPILGGSGHVKYWDVPMPNYDDIRIALGRDKDLAKPDYTQWNTKVAKAVFRGAPTGCGYTTETNMRLKLATMKSDDLDVGVITVRQEGLKFDPGEGLGRLDMSAKLKPVARMTLEQQAKYKYIIHVDGNVAAYRLLKMMTLGSVILKVRGPYTTWVDHVLKDREHYISVKEDLSNLQEVIEWCKTHDEECRMIAKRGQEFATRALSRDYIESTFAKLVWSTVQPRTQQQKKQLTYVPLTIDQARSMTQGTPTILVPFRERVEQKRGEQLSAFVKFMKTNHPEWKVIIVEQSQDEKKFNRGALLNAGARIAKDAGDTYVIFHDVDLLPEDSIVPYYTALPSSPIHIAKAWTTKYDSPTFLGGVLSMSLKDIETVNGFPNTFWGWGGEDDALRNRMGARGLRVFQPTVRGEGFVEQEHVDSRQQTEWKNMRKWEDLEADRTGYKTNGFSTVQYNVVKKEAYTEAIVKITVELK